MTNGHDSEGGARRSQDDSAALLARWQELGDRAALEQLLAIEIASLKARIRAQAGYMTDATASASDIAQEAVLRLLNVQTPPHFDNPRALRGYLWVAAWRLLAERLRTKGGAITRIDVAQSGAFDTALATTGGLGAVEDHDREIALGLAINLLEPAEQEILSLAYLRDLGIEGAARELGVSHDAAKMRLVRARRTLAHKLLRWSELIG